MAILLNRNVTSDDNLTTFVGDHFTKLGDMQSAQTTKANSPNAADMCIRSSTSPTQMTSADEEKMQKILAKSEVREALMDADIEKLLETLRTNPDAAQRWVLGYSY